MTLYLVRHADAKSRTGWHGPDELRPLTKRGQRQALGLVDLLRDAKVTAISSSPALRCVDTVAPLGATLRIDVHEASDLFEGSEAKAVMSLVAEAVARVGDTVLCTHGDLIPEILRRLAKAGAALDGDRWAKGSTWELVVDDGAVVAGRYHPPTDVD